MNTIPLILAGGKGERFWPLSRSSRPKQLLPLFSSQTMIEETVIRVKKFCTKNAKPLVVTGKDCASGINAVLKGKHSVDRIVEPQGKNTAPAIALAAAWMQKKYGDAVMLVVSADHAIAPQTAFFASVKEAVRLATENDALVVFGVRPTRPDVGYGYINITKQIAQKKDISSYIVNGFVEKPTLAVAKKYLRSGKYLWNSGMFVWKVSVILEAFKKYMPDLYGQVMAASKANFSKKAIETFYGSCVKESIDYGIMEQSKNIAAVAGSFFWDDIGSWDSMSRVHKQNAKGTVSVGATVLEAECDKSIIYNSSKKAVAAIGLNDIALVVTDDAVLAIARPLLPDLKKYLAAMKDAKFPAELF
jgi:mannose-1-phosphate guanylyltransferase